MLAPIPATGRAGNAQRVRDVPPQRLYRADVDLRTFPMQPLPITQPSFDALMLSTALPLAMATRFEGTSGDDVAAIGGTSFSHSGTLRDRKLVGLLKASGPTWYRGVEFTDGSTATLTGDDTTICDEDDHDVWALGIVFRGTRAPSALRVIAHKWQASGTGVGWWLYVSGGTMYFQIGDGANTQTLTIGAVPFDESWHKVVIKFDRASNALSAFIDWTTNPTPITFGTVVGSTGNPIPLTFGNLSSLGAAPMQLAYAFALHDAAADLMNTIFAARLWRLSTKPAGVTTYTRAQSAGFAVSVDPVDGEEFVVWHGTQPAYRRSLRWGGIGLALHGAANNIQTQSRIATWGGFGVTFGDSVDGPTGTRTAIRLTADSPGAYASRNFLSAAAAITASFVVAPRAAAGAATSQLVVRAEYGTSGMGSVLAYEDFTIGPGYTRIDFSFTGAGGTEAVALKLLNAGDAVDAWMCNVRSTNGHAPGPMIPTYGSSVTMVQPTIECVPGGGEYTMQSSEGGMYIEAELAALPPSASVAYFLSAHGGNDKRQLFVADDGTITGRVYDSAGALTVPQPSLPADADAATKQLALRLQWRGASFLPGGSVTTRISDERDGVDGDGETTTFATAETMTTLRLGTDHSGASGLEGLVRLVRAYADVVDLTP